MLRRPSPAIALIYSSSFAFFPAWASVEMVLDKSFKVRVRKDERSGRITNIVVFVCKSVVALQICKRFVLGGGTGGGGGSFDLSSDAISSAGWVFCGWCVCWLGGGGFDRSVWRYVSFPIEVGDFTESRVVVAGK